MVKLVKETEHEPALYEFSYLKDSASTEGERHVGVMAQDLLSNRAWASKVDRVVDVDDGLIYVVDSEFVEGHSKWEAFVR